MKRSLLVSNVREGRFFVRGIRKTSNGGLQVCKKRQLPTLVNRVRINAPGATHQLTSRSQTQNSSTMASPTFCSPVLALKHTKSPIGLQHRKSSLLLNVLHRFNQQYCLPKLPRHPIRIQSQSAHTIHSPEPASQPLHPALLILFRKRSPTTL